MRSQLSLLLTALNGIPLTQCFLYRLDQNSMHFDFYFAGGWGWGAKEFFQKRFQKRWGGGHKHRIMS